MGGKQIGRRRQGADLGVFCMLNASQAFRWSREQPLQQVWPETVTGKVSPVNDFHSSGSCDLEGMSVLHWGPRTQPLDPVTL